MSAASYRLMQGVRALTAFARPLDDTPARQSLTPAQMVLFKRLNRSEQLHSLAVWRAIHAQADSTPRALAAAALLHDVGKARYPLRVWQKTVVILVRKFARPLYCRWIQGSPLNLWTRGFVVNAHHPAWGAQMVAEADGGADALLVWLIAHHADPLERHATHPHVDLLRRLKAADDAH